MKNNNLILSPRRPANLIVWLLLLLFIGLYSESASAARKHAERWYQEKWCTEGKMEYRLQDRTRVDCLTATHAVEVDFANNWYNGYTQARYYAAHTGMRAALLLIVENESDRRYVERAQRLQRHYGDAIDIWTIRSTD